MGEVELSGEMLEFISIEWWSVVGHHYCQHAFSQKKVSQVSQHPVVVC